MKKNKKLPLDKKPLMVLSRRAVAGWACAAFFVCAWMFFIGVLVGRGTAPVSFDIAAIQKKLEASRQTLMEQLRTHGKAGIAKDKTKLDFYEALKDNREDARIDKKQLSSSTAREIEPLPVNKLSVEHKEENEKGIDEKEETPEPPPVESSQRQSIEPKSKPGASVTTYTIQAASLKDVQDADRLVASLKKKGFHAHRQIGKVPGKGIWYRVRIGEYKSKADAFETMNRLKKAGLKPIIVEK
jgi:DedD protein